MGLVAEEPGGLGDVDEDAAALVAQERVGLPDDEPPSTRDEDVDVPVVVVVRLLQVAAAEQAERPRRGRVIDETARTVVQEDSERVGRSPRRGHEVEEPVPVEVVHHGTAHVADHVDAQRARHVPKRSDLVLDLERFRRKPPALGYTVRVFAEHHVSEVEEPARSEIVGSLGQQLLVEADRLAHRLRVGPRIRG